MSLFTFFTFTWSSWSKLVKAPAFKVVLNYTKLNLVTFLFPYEMFQLQEQIWKQILNSTKFSKGCNFSEPGFLYKHNFKYSLEGQNRLVIYFPLLTLKIWKVGGIQFCVVCSLRWNLLWANYYPIIPNFLLAVVHNLNSTEISRIQSSISNYSV